jgi:hypothetical protein
MKSKQIKAAIASYAMIAAILSLTACSGGGGSAGTTSETGSGATAGTGSSGSTGTGSTGGSTGTGGGNTTPGGGISTSSNGVPSQKYMSLSIDSYNLDWSKDGSIAKVTVRVADTAGNPVPDGTIVQFSVGGGSILTSCKLAGVASGASKLSACTVDFATQNRRPSTGYVEVLAWLEGEEAYIDLNANGQYDTGEPYADSGRIFRDDNHNTVYDVNFDELSIDATLTTQPGLGTAACAAPDARLTNAAGIEQPYSVQNTCDGVWGKTLVRATATMAQSNSARIAVKAGLAAGELLVGSLANPSNVFVGAPGGTKMSLKVPTGCTSTLSRDTVFSTDINPISVFISLSGTCTGSEFNIESNGIKYTYPL